MTLVRRLYCLHVPVAVILLSSFADCLFAADKIDSLIRGHGMLLKKESFDRDPNWLGLNNRSALTHAPREIRQDFGYSPKSNHAGGDSAGEIGGVVSPAGESAFYGRKITAASFEQRLNASGRLSLGKGGTHLLLGFFNSDSVNEWRTPNTLAIRLNGRGEKFFAYVEYCTSKWRAGGDSTPFPSTKDPQTGRMTLTGYPSDQSLAWSLVYDPLGNDGRGIITATIGDDTAICQLDEGHQLDGATFNRFGILNVMKSADKGSEVWLDDVVINDGPRESFDQDPQWDGRNHRSTAETRIVRPWFNFGFSETVFAGGKKGELGGQIFRGDCRMPERIACFGDRTQDLTLDRPLKASGKIAMTRGVTDSTTVFGFYHSERSVRVNDSQRDAVPDSLLGIHIEGPSSEGFKVYPVLRAHDQKSTLPAVREFPTIYPDGKSHDWSLEYDSNANEGKGRITVTLDGISGHLDLRADENKSGTVFDRFGIVTSWIDGNSQNVYLDDITYTYQHTQD